MKKFFLSIISFLFLYSILFSLINASMGIEKVLTSLLPESGEVKGWSRNESFEEYKGEDLFFYINGGAEIYNEYGFERVIVQDYTSSSGKSASLEIYEMTDSSSAYGMYSFKSTGDGKMLELGQEGKLQDYYLNFWKGKYLITITGFDEDEETIAGLQSLAKAVDTRIKDMVPSERPALVGLLPEQGLKPHDVKYFQGNLGLFNSYPFTTKGVFEVDEAIKGTYTGGYDIYILSYDDEGICRKVFQAVSGGLKQEPRYKSLKAGDGSLELTDEKDTHILIRPYRNYITIILGASDFEKAAKMADELQSHISGR